MPKYSLKKVDPKDRLLSKTRKNTVVNRATRKHFLKTFKRIQRHKAREGRIRLAGRKSRKSMRSSRQVDMSIYRKLTNKCENVSEFADFLLENEENEDMYDKLVTYIDEINDMLKTNLATYMGMISINNKTMENIPSDDEFETLVALSRRYTYIAHDLLEQSTTHKIIKPVLQNLTDFIKKIYIKLNDALESFEGELQLASTMNEENSNVSNNSGLNAIMSRFRNLGLGK
jgi:hypothetical protein